MADPVTGYVVDLCTSWAKIGEAPAGRFHGVLRNLEVGEWRLEGAVTAVDLEPGVSLEDVDTVRLVRGRDILFAGFVAPMPGGGIGGLEITSRGGGDQFVLSGPDLWAALGWRLAYPNPASVPPWTVAHDVRSGVASTVAAGYVDANLGSGALADRRFPGATIVDAVTGLSGVWSARLQPLDDLVARVCVDGSIICRPSVDFTGALRIFLGAARDRSARTVLSDKGDLSNVVRRRVPASVTFALAGGQGELTARTFASSGTASGAGRRETFSDQSSLSSYAEVLQAAVTAVAFGGESWSIRADITIAGAQRFDFLTDYDVGDMISVEIDSVRHPVVVEAVTFEISAEHKLVRPVFGDAAPNELVGMVRDIAGLARRLDNTVA